MDSRLFRALALYIYAVLGVFLMFAPWTVVWDSAALALLPQSLQPWVTSGWARGAVTAVGALDILIAMQAALGLWGGGDAP